MHEPVEIIMPEAYLNDSCTTTSLYHRISQKFRRLPIIFVSSQHFNALIGWDLIGIYCTNEWCKIKQIIKQK
jgi:hypothetical protein